MILDCPYLEDGNAISGFFCKQMKAAKDVIFNYDWDKGHGRAILSGAADQAARILQTHHAEWKDKTTSQKNRRLECRFRLFYIWLKDIVCA